MLEGLREVFLDDMMHCFSVLIALAAEETVEDEALIDVVIVAVLGIVGEADDGEDPGGAFEFEFKELDEEDASDPFCDAEEEVIEENFADVED